jgi:hypothetical protein
MKENDIRPDSVTVAILYKLPDEDLKKDNSTMEIIRRERLNTALQYNIKRAEELIETKRYKKLEDHFNLLNSKGQLNVDIGNKIIEGTTILVIEMIL